MKFKGTIIITDPCYIIKKEKGKQDDWERCEYGSYMEALGITNYISESTVYGDWSCTTWSISNEDIKATVEKINSLSGDVWEAGEKYGWSSTQRLACSKVLSDAFSDMKKLGVFCADAGLVAVFLLDEVLKYNPGISKWIEEHPWCSTVIPDFDGDVQYYLDKDRNAHIIGKGNINFFTTQTGL